MTVESGGGVEQRTTPRALVVVADQLDGRSCDHGNPLSMKGNRLYTQRGNGACLGNNTILVCGTVFLRVEWMGEFPRMIRMARVE
jgi:hypothetical protein